MELRSSSHLIKITFLVYLSFSFKIIIMITVWHPDLVRSQRTSWIKINQPFIGTVENHGEMLQCSSRRCRLAKFFFLFFSYPMLIVSLPNFFTSGHFIFRLFSFIQITLTRQPTRQSVVFQHFFTKVSCGNFSL